MLLDTRSATADELTVVPACLPAPHLGELVGVDYATRGTRFPTLEDVKTKDIWFPNFYNCFSVVLQ